MKFLNKLSFPKVWEALAAASKRSELDALTRKLDKAVPIMEEMELLMEEKFLCDEKLREIRYRLEHPSKTTKIPLVSQIIKATSPDELKSQMAAYRTMQAGLDGHMLQLVMHQCKDLMFLGTYLYPVAVGEIVRSLEDGAADSLHDAIGLYENQLERWRSSGINAELLRKAQMQSEYMEKLIKSLQD